MPRRVENSHSILEILRDVSTSLDTTATEMRILIAPDKFKGALGARGVAENIAAGLCDVLRDAKIDIVPMDDGGEGTAEIISQALGDSWLKMKVKDTVGRGIE